MNYLADISFFDTLTAHQNVRFVANDDPSDLSRGLDEFIDAGTDRGPSIGDRDLSDSYRPGILDPSITAQVLRVVKAVEAGKMGAKEGCLLLLKAGISAADINAVLLRLKKA